jgi:hypothetical protein
VTPGVLPLGADLAAREATSALGGRVTPEGLLSDAELRARVKRMKAPRLGVVARAKARPDPAPVTGSHRRRFLRRYAVDCLGRQRLDGALALDLVLGANRLRCVPPLERADVVALVDRVAESVLHLERPAVA